MRRIDPFWRGIAIVAIVAGLIVALDQEQSLATAGELVRFGFYIAIAVAAYFLWRDFGRREIAVWPRRQQWVFYGAVGLFLVDVGWYFATPLSGRNLLVFFVVAAVCIYAAVHTWLEQHRYS